MARITQHSQSKKKLLEPLAIHEWLYILADQAGGAFLVAFLFPLAWLPILSGINPLWMLFWWSACFIPLHTIGSVHRRKLPLAFIGALVMLTASVLPICLFAFIAGSGMSATFLWFTNTYVSLFLIMFLVVGASFLGAQFLRFLFD